MTFLEILRNFPMELNFILNNDYQSFLSQEMQIFTKKTVVQYVDFNTILMPSEIKQLKLNPNVAETKRKTNSKLVSY